MIDDTVDRLCDGLRRLIKEGDRENTRRYRYDEIDEDGEEQKLALG